jgi:hypothetical protein
MGHAAGMAMPGLAHPGPSPFSLFLSSFFLPARVANSPGLAHFLHSTAQQFSRPVLCLKIRLLILEI